jgi:hypothetical protein
MVFTYQPDAKARIAALGSNVVLAFLDKVPEKFREGYLAGLRPMPGFRPDEPRELKARMKKLAQSLCQSSSGTRGNEREWNALGHIWAGWVKATYKTPAERALKVCREEKFDFDRFLTTALEGEGGDGLAQEDVEDMFKFSPFSPSDSANSLIRGLPSRAEVAKRLEIRDLKSKVASLEEAIADLQKAFGSVKGDGGGVEKKQLESMGQRLTTLANLVEKTEARCLVVEELGVSQNKTFGKTLDLLSQGNETISKKVNAHEVRLLALDKADTDLVGTVRKLEGVVKVLQKALCEYEKSRGMQNDSDSNSVDAATASRFRVDRWSIAKGTTLQAIETLTTLRTALTSNYRSIGIRENCAEKLALSVAASVSCGQMTQFVGPLADLIADTTLQTVSSKRTVAWDVPAGLCDGTLTSLLLAEASSASENTTGVLLRGFNKSAFDLYGYEVKRILVNRLMGIDAPNSTLIFVATALQSDTCLPIGSSSTELGPVIDTTALTWLRPKAKPTPGELQSTAFSIGPEEITSEVLVDLGNQVADMPIVKSELWRRAFKSARERASQLVDNQSDLHQKAVEALVTNWVVPWVKLERPSQAEVTALISEHIHAVADGGAPEAILENNPATPA